MRIDTFGVGVLAASVAISGIGAFWDIVSSLWSVRLPRPRRRRLGFPR